jgi:hypothetical protein
MGCPADEAEPVASWRERAHLKALESRKADVSMQEPGGAGPREPLDDGGLRRRAGLFGHVARAAAAEVTFRSLWVIAPSLVLLAPIVRLQTAAFGKRGGLGYAARHRARRRDALRPRSAGAVRDDAVPSSPAKRNGGFMMLAVSLVAALLSAPASHPAAASVTIAVEHMT